MNFDQKKCLNSLCFKSGIYNSKRDKLESNFIIIGVERNGEIRLIYVNLRKKR